MDRRLARHRKQPRKRNTPVIKIHKVHNYVDKGGTMHIEGDQTYHQGENPPQQARIQLGEPYYMYIAIDNNMVSNTPSNNVFYVFLCAPLR